MSDDVLQIASEFLSKSGYDVVFEAAPGIRCVGFENDVLFGFLIVFESVELLLEQWSNVSEEIYSRYQFQIRSSRDKAWNAYSILLAEGQANEQQRRLFSEIEEDLVGTRKIARGVSPDEVDIRNALLPVLRLQKAPQLEPVDMAAEIRVRAADIPGSALEAFLDAAPDDEVIRLMGRRHED